MNRVRFLNLALAGDDLARVICEIRTVLEHGMLVNGPEVERFEHQLALYCQRRYCVGVSSGTDALYLGLKALDIGPGDEVITTALSWIATANAIVLAGATPVFADITEDLSIDPGSISRLITDKTKAIMPVHYSGKIAPMNKIMAIAKSKGLLVIEDASQAFGARQQGQIAGSVGDMSCFSLNPMKTFGAIGEAGAILTNNSSIKERLISLRYNGTIEKETCVEPGLNGRIDTIQAAVLSYRLTIFEHIIAVRQKHAQRYRHLLRHLTTVQLPVDKAHEDSNYTFTIQTDSRDTLKHYLEQNHIETKIYHPILMPMQPAYEGKYQHEITHAKRIVSRILSLPIHEKLHMDEIELTASKIIEYFNK